MKQFIKHKIPLGYIYDEFWLTRYNPLGDHIFEVDTNMMSSINRYYIPTSSNYIHMLFQHFINEDVEITRMPVLRLNSHCYMLRQNSPNICYKFKYHTYSKLVGNIIHFNLA